MLSTSRSEVIIIFRIMSWIKIKIELFQFSVVLFLGSYRSAVLLSLSNLLYMR